MGSTTNKKLPQPWHTKSFHLARFWMVMSFFCYFCAESLLIGKFPISIGWTFTFLFYELSVIASWHSSKPEMTPLIVDGLLESQMQFKKLLSCIVGMVAAYGVGLYIGYCLVSDYHIHLLLLAIVLVGANVSGYFLMKWLREARAIMKQYHTGTASNTTHFVASPTVSSPTYTQPVTQSHAQQLRAGNGGRP